VIRINPLNKPKVVMRLVLLFFTENGTIFVYHVYRFEPMYLMMTTLTDKIDLSSLFTRLPALHHVNQRSSNGVYSYNDHVLHLNIGCSMRDLKMAHFLK